MSQDETAPASVGDTFKSELLKSIGDTVDESLQTIGEARDVRNTDDFTKRVKMFAKLENARRKIEEIADTINREAKKLGQEVLEDMSQEGLEKITADGLTLFPLEKPYVSKKADSAGATKQAICEALKKHGFGYLVKNEDTYAPGQLKSAILEMKKDDKEVPEDIAKLLNIGSTVELTSRLNPKK